MANFGFSRLRVVNPYDVAFREARSAVGAAPLLHAAQEFGSLGEAVAAVARPEKIRRATAGETEQITAMLLEALERSGYVNPVTAASTEEKVRRLVRRMDMKARDAPVLMGMLRQILWKLGK